jgi:hypothetical protein
MALVGAPLALLRSKERFLGDQIPAIRGEVLAHRPHVASHPGLVELDAEIEATGHELNPPRED